MNVMKLWHFDEYYKIVKLWHFWWISQNYEIMMYNLNYNILMIILKFWSDEKYNFLTMKIMTFWHWKLWHLKWKLWHFEIDIMTFWWKLWHFVEIKIMTSCRWKLWYFDEKDIFGSKFLHFNER